MKPIKILGFAVLVALTAMAFVGASSAMAESTTLCSADGSGCGVSHVHETSTSKAKLLTTLLTVECDVLFLGDTLWETTNPLVIHGNFTYTNCGGCTATEENGPAEIKVLKLGHETADVTGEGLVHVVCGSSLDCSYNGVGLKGTAKGPLLSTAANGEVSLVKQITNKETGGFLCPSESKLDITTTPLSATYLGSTTGHYCVKYERAIGFYLNVNNGNKSECIELDAKREGLYALVTGQPGLASGTTVCVNLAEKVGLYETFNTTSGLCEKDNKANTSLYEKGTIQ